MAENKVTSMAVGQVWVTNDPREIRVPKRVISVSADGVLGGAVLQPVNGGRKTKVQCRKFLRRQGTKSGYVLVKHENENEEV